MMVIAIGLSSYNLALFHLVNHAFYKALLFLGAGAVIHAVADNQDFRRYGGLISFLPLTYSVILIASLSLVAFPYMTGFYSKDFILESAFGKFTFSGVAVYTIATIGAIFTTLYSAKVLYLTFISPALGPKTSYSHAHEGDLFMMLPLIILAVFSIFFGHITKDIFLGLGTGFFTDNSIFIHPINEIVINTEFAVLTLFKLLPFFFTVFFSLLPIIISDFLPAIVLNFKLSTLGRDIYGFFNQRFLVEKFYNKYITNLVLYLGGLITKVLDKGVVELIGPFGLEKKLVRFSKNLNKLSTGVVTSYALYILVGLIFLILIVYLGDGLISSSLSVLLIILTFFSLSLTNGDFSTRPDPNTKTKAKTNIKTKEKPFFLIHKNTTIRTFSTSTRKFNSDRDIPPSPQPSSSNNSSSGISEDFDSDDESIVADAITTDLTNKEVLDERKKASTILSNTKDYFERTEDPLQRGKAERSIERMERRIANLDQERLIRNIYTIDSESTSASDSKTTSKSDSVNDSVKSEEGSSNKRKFKEDEDSSTQPNEPKRFKQDSRDITSDTEPYDITGGEDC